MRINGREPEFTICSWNVMTMTSRGVGGGVPAGDSEVHKVSLADANGDEIDINVICCYAPTETSSAEKKVMFYSDLSSLAGCFSGQPAILSSGPPTWKPRTLGCACRSWRRGATAAAEGRD